MIGFNPTLVRLRRPHAEIHPEPKHRFQSHAGSIEACHPPGYRNFFNMLFQSHAGSIEALLLHFLTSHPQMFQSHAGSIEAVEQVVIVITTMVFQSHAGSIEAQLVFGRLGRGMAFQSHAGSIEATTPCGVITLYDSVSIPRWFD